MKIVVYICSLVVAILCIALAVELGLQQLLPDAYRGYLMDAGDNKVRWVLGPFEPSQPATGFNAPIDINKPANTIRIVSLGASGTEGWLSAITVFNKYGQEWALKDISSYSRAIQFSMNQIRDLTGKKVEVINLGIAAYNIADVTRMLKDSLALEPDLFLIQIGGNETWTGERSNWAAYIDEDKPYLYTELANEILAETKGGWGTLKKGNDAFNPMALFQSKPQPVVHEPIGREEGINQRLVTYRETLTRLGDFLERKKIPALFLLPSQNIADYQPFGSMAKPGTSEAQLDELNQLLIEALADRSLAAKQKYLDILAIDGGIAEANFQLGKILLAEGDTAKAREHFWKANDRDLVLKRLPGPFHAISREFVAERNFPHIDVMRFFEAKSATGVVGYNWLDDDVHPHRQAQFDLGNAVITKVLQEDLLKSSGYRGNASELPEFQQYNDWTGFDQQAAGTIAYLKAAHNFLTFGRYRQRLRWDPQPATILEPILANLDIANSKAPSNQSQFLSAVLNLSLGQQQKAESVIAAMDCGASRERAATVNNGVITTFKQIFGRSNPELGDSLRSTLTAMGCSA